MLFWCSPISGLHMLVFPFLDLNCPLFYYLTQSLILIGSSWNFILEFLDDFTVLLVWKFFDPHEEFIIFLFPILNINNLLSQFFLHHFDFFPNVSKFRFVLIYFSQFFPCSVSLFFQSIFPAFNWLFHLLNLRLAFLLLLDFCL